ncbi:MAG: methyltransferase domain-containing protein [Bacteroidota bacterium]
MDIKHQVEYYRQRAREYDRIYQKPERQSDLHELHDYLKTSFSQKSILEIACGTGYWTQTIAQKAQSIYATDINESMLELAKGRDYTKATMQFQCIDYRDLPAPASPYEGLFSGFLWSHIPKSDLTSFIAIMLKQVQRDASLIFIDNQYVEGSSTPISRTDTYGNTYQKRRLQFGEQFEIIKNFPSREEIEVLLHNFECEINWRGLTYYWILEVVKK